MVIFHNSDENICASLPIYNKFPSCGFLLFQKSKPYANPLPIGCKAENPRA